MGGGRWEAGELALEALHCNPEALAPRFRNLYHRAAAHLSEEVLPRYLEAAGDALVVLTADHGENWGECLPPGRRVEHVFDLHGRWMEDATTRVPLVVWGRGARAGEVPGFARGVDLAPTLAELAGLGWPAGGDGVSLAGSVRTGCSTGLEAALTVSSWNTHRPEEYPAEGTTMWRGFSLRTAAERRAWDAVEGAGDADLRREWARSRGPVATRLRPGRAVRRRLRLLGYLE